MVLDKGVEKISEKAFDAAVRAGEEEHAEDRQEEPTDQSKLLRSVKAEKATRSTPGIENAIESGLVKADGYRKLRLTPLGEYLLPEARREDTEAESGPAPEATASPAA